MLPYYLLSAALPIFIMLPLSIKWQIQKTYAIPWLLLMSTFSCSITWITGVVFPGSSGLIGTLAGLVAAVSLTVLVLLTRFYRDPERTIPDVEGLLVSPADGEVIYVKNIENGEFPFAVKKGKVISLDEFILENSFMKKGVQIGIAMNFLNVHVNRMPISGTVKTIRRIPGSFRSLKHLGSLLENERVCTLIEGKGLTVGVVQIASRLVRRITAYFSEGDSCRIGDRMGMIRFGSQVDLLIPETPGLQVLINVGDEINAGETVVARYSINE
jgi:phosphatidylserine decarboxylase